ncbi:MAG: endonuclease MutS2 [Desulfuromonadales bacterium]|nr:endonuclease MutS2 [Desulfuromonadales bacterium]
MTASASDRAESLHRLEFASVVAALAGRTQTPYGRDLALALRPQRQKAAISEALQQTREAIALLVEHGPLPVGCGADLREPLVGLQVEGLLLEAEQLRDIAAVVTAAAACRTLLRDQERAPSLGRLAVGLTPLPELAGAIGRCIGPRDEILDSASAELADLRRQLQRERSRVRQQLERLLGSDELSGVFQDSLVTDRNGRYVVPVRADHSGRLKGFIHDVSASGQTLFIEPAGALDGNNRIQSLERGIEREIRRILTRLTGMVRSVRERLLANQEILARLDLRQAGARLSLDLDAVVPELADEPLLELSAARHPLLLLAEPPQPAAVPVDIRLGAGQSALIISGPNTGGKTVALKTAGLLVLMVRAGLPIPCAPGSRLFPFAPVLADIGDEQSIEQSLSTFSGHLARMKSILEQAGPHALVLLDELGTGTDPNEGAALAMAFLDLLRQARARVMATTHLHIIKGYAQLEDGVDNAAVEFDPDTLQPTYRLQYGIPGASHAFTIASRLGLPEALLLRAADYLGQNQRSGEEIIERLQSLRIALEEELDSAGQLRREAEQERDQRRRLREELEQRRAAILEETRRQGVELLTRAEARLRDLFADARPGRRVTASEQARLTGELRGLKQGLPAPSATGPERVPTEVTVNERLYVPALGVDGLVVRSTGRQVELDIGGKRMRQPLAALRQYQPRRFVERQLRPAKIRDRVERQAFRPRLVLVGKRVDEAQLLLERFLDDALLHNQLQLEVVHGAGQGILRRAIREQLAARRDVASFQAADVAQGGDNITVVEIRH